MTKDQFLDYWEQWLRRTDPAIALRRDNDVLIMTRADGVKFSGFPQPCNCDDPECLGWVMVAHKETPHAH